MKKALITGVTGQDGSYLAEFLLQKGYEVYGLRRAASTFNTERIDHIIQFPHSTGGQLKLIYGDLTDSNNLDKILAEVKPDEIYNLGAQSHVHLSFQVPEYTAQIDAIGVLRLLDGLKNNCPNARFYQASTSELFGKAKEIPQSENTPFYPRSPYASAKLYAYWTTVNYREAYNLFACNGILFNHESPRRGKTFVTRKITQAVAKIYYGLQEKLYLGNLDAKRDWGYAPEYVEAMWLMLQQETPDDFIISSGETHTVREFCEKAFSLVGINLEWIGEGINEKGIDKKTRNTIVEIDARYFRPTEVDVLLGDNSKARTKLGWSPKTKFDQLIDIMVQEDLREYKSAKPVAVEAPKTIGRMLYKQIDSCRICGNTRLIDVLDLGIFGLSGVFPLPNEKVPEGPLAIVRCGEGGCGLLQLKHNYDLELLYGENYGYRSGLNNSMVKHLTEIVRKIESRVDINMGDIVLDIGSNDSTMLQKYQAKDLVLVGVDPTAEKFKEYYPNNIVRIPEFFSADTIKQRFSQKVKVVTSIAMFYDLEHPFEIVKQISEVLADDGVWVLEQSYMPHMLDNTSYDTICHEHLEYYSLKSLKWMFDKAGLKIID
ncbi:GDP-mannose 4,6-dehydratase, partial [candidate division WWE3 bacterium RIFOXYD1_FULL_40_11]